MTLHEKTHRSSTNSLKTGTNSRKMVLNFSSINVAGFFGPPKPKDLFCPNYSKVSKCLVLVRSEDLNEICGDPRESS